MLRCFRPIAIVAALLALASPATAASGAPAGESRAGTADHLGGSFTACGRIVDYSAPIVGTDGSMTVSGIDATEDHAFVIDDEAAVDPLVAGLAASGDWTCLALTGDGMGILVDVAVAGAVVCAPLAAELGMFVLPPGSTDPFTTVVLDGDAGDIVAADPALHEPLTSIATTPDTAEVCLEFGLAADGTLDSILLDYAEAPGVPLPARIACGPVEGTGILYRDPASQPYPEGTTVGVAGFFVDATLVAGPHLDVLAYHLDANADVCLLAEIVDNVIVQAASRNLFDTTVCGELEVVGGLIFVEALVVSQGLTGVNFGEPTPASIALACYSPRALPGGVDGLLQVCGDFEGATDDTFTVSGVTFHLSTAIDDSDLPAEGGPQSTALIGPDPFDPFGPANPARVTTSTLAGCGDGQSSPPPLPDTSAATAGRFGTFGVALVLLGLLAGGGVVLVVRRQPQR